jgi:prepilin-type N-terminal cleavage/methylation domain-containing protein
MHKQKGFSLLEIMLVLAITATVLVLGIRYFQINLQNLKVEHAVEQINALTNSSYEWLTAQKQEDFSGSSQNAISLAKLSAAGLIPNGNLYQKNPWGGNNSVAPGQDPNYVKISFTQLTKHNCFNLLRQLQNLAHSNACEADSNKTYTYSGEF